MWSEVEGFGARWCAQNLPPADVVDVQFFSDQFERTLDGKGRMILPSTFRDDFAEGLVFAPGMDRCVEVWQADAFAERLEVLMRQAGQAGWDDAGHRKKVRVYSQTASRAELDGQGRVLLPARLREFAVIDREIVVAGTVDHLEIWAQDRYAGFMASSLDAYADTDSSADPLAMFAGDAS